MIRAGTRITLFFAALNPEKTPRGIILCLWLTELILHIHLENRFYLGELWEMVKARDSRGVRLESITVICTQQLVPPKEVSKLRQHVSRVEYKLEDEYLSSRNGMLPFLTFRDFEDEE
ncbi:hypothetical protein BDM02DRAFT_3123574 [Thelephora ganbajun]|uniref:Uncharacterized protein n=1 Tax=Thelephora ganbajun TaxID=370292 RepID=A0ACB6Z220_THEGA|nr:hypothetical protein BDM02DRAFT_3123574 [Thelephora ganbajun]